MSLLKPFRILFIAGALFLMGRPAFAQSNIYLDVAGIQGESTASGHLKQMVATAFSLNCANTNGTPHFGELSVAKYVDRASPLLMLASAQGSVTNVTLYAQKSVNGSATDYYVIKLTNAKVSSVGDSGSAGGGQATEVVTFQYQKIEIDYTIFNGSIPSGTAVMTWDTTINQPF